MEQIFISQAQKEKLREMADAWPESIPMGRFAGSLMRQGLIVKVSGEGEKPSRHSLTDKGLQYLKEVLDYKIGDREFID